MHMKICIAIWPNCVANCYAIPAIAEPDHNGVQLQDPADAPTESPPCCPCGVGMNAMYTVHVSSVNILRSSGVKK